MSPSEELRAAATHLREKASAASPGLWQSYSGRIDSPNGTVAVALNGHCDSEWIALASPLLAESLAAWLERVAYSHGSLNLAADRVLGGDPEYAEADAILRRGPYDMGEALKVARSILGTSDEAS